MLLLTEASVHVACLQAGKAGRAWDRSGLGDKTTGWGWLKVKKKTCEKDGIGIAIFNFSGLFSTNHIPA